MPETLPQRVLYLSNFSRLGGHPGSTSIYYTLGWSYYWPHMAIDVYQTVKECDSGLRNRGTIREHRPYMKLFQAAGPLEFIIVDFLGPLPKTKRGNEHVMVIKDRFSKMK